MFRKLSLQEGEIAVKLARKAIDTFFKNRIIMPPPTNLPEVFYEKRGVFTTLHTYPDHNLRGCIGFPEPILPLAEAIIESAISAAFRDPRFPPLTYDEFQNVVVEVTILTPPQEIKFSNPQELMEQIKIGEDGLIVKCGFHSGLLLPQVPVEYNWTVEEFLAHTCMKAGLPPDCFLNPECKWYKFQGQIFEEKYPNGEVIEKKLK
ncbi:MAG TPA: TIGR00296 family protein [Desulfurobacteriaceae bacterium]|nr:TIGR00296 family protein [Desulfurobacteriaceae bacterium]